MFNPLPRASHISNTPISEYIQPNMNFLPCRRYQVGGNHGNGWYGFLEPSSSCSLKGRPELRLTVRNHQFNRDLWCHSNALVFMSTTKQADLINYSCRISDLLYIRHHEDVDPPCLSLSFNEENVWLVA